MTTRRSESKKLTLGCKTPDKSGAAAAKTTPKSAAKAKADAAKPAAPKLSVDESGRVVETEVVLQTNGVERTVEVSSRAYEKLVVPTLPKYGDMKKWMTQSGRNVVACAPYMRGNS